MSASAASSSSFLPLPPARDIPASFTASVRSWWSVGEKGGTAAEARLLRRLPFFRPSPDSPIDASQAVTASSAQVPLANPKHFINTLSILPTTPAPNAPPPTVVLHGYGAGLGFFFQNFPVLAAWAGRRGTPVYALDWLGMGRSARPPFAVHAKRADTAARVAEAEAFFIDSLEEWRAKMGLEVMTLVGHSLGAYLGVAYALKFPERVHKLVLLSPAGVPRDPHSTSDPARELTESQDDVVEAPSSGDEAVQPATKGKVGAIHAEQAREKRQESKTRKLLMYLWEEGWSPFQVVRNTMFYGPLIVGKYSARRFSSLSAEETRDMHDYIVNITLAKGSGEYCISHILAPGAHARLPLVDRVAALPAWMPVTFVYGEHDWMDPEGGAKAVENLRLAGNGQGRMYIVPNAGHHVYLDNVKATNDLMVKELDRPVKRPKA
ncbi:alpha beta-hydrolase [Athelia psychrophila]|uniref:Alpha beta-hydrolase n=1 Tax=Athelia psychrophila TaxID=1759441 RepID=A0A166N2L6_9AGAM|nr:alpha beta-hydrolase [Fibularhizoctonia sp. CBS 109695]